MAETQIEWADATWNPVAGCTIVTTGCTNCYAVEMAKYLDATGIAKCVGITPKSGERAALCGRITRRSPSRVGVESLAGPP
jgi:protein gp37